jgi:hypothetical protein
VLHDFRAGPLPMLPARSALDPDSCPLTILNTLRGHWPSRTLDVAPDLRRRERPVFEHLEDAHGRGAQLDQDLTCSDTEREE